MRWGLPDVTGSSFGVQVCGPLNHNRVVMVQESEVMPSYT